MNPKIFLVGGACRDKLLGNEPKDLDYVVVGADLQWMLDQGFKQVGASFPVFLHPETGDEYAMARREKKVAPGYQGFEFEFGPDVTLEEDLSRRDLTINSIAYDFENDKYIDPFNGIDDLENGIIRHTSDAFAEDPLRVMRVARFAARYGFKVDSETKKLCAELVSSGELDALSADRIWGEIAKLFSEVQPSVGIRFLQEIGALETKRLDGLVHKDYADFISNPFSIGYEFSASAMEKMMVGLRLQFLSKEELETFRVPSNISREAKFIQEVFNHTITFSSVDDIVRLFDKFREEFKRGDLSKAESFTRKGLSLQNFDIVFNQLKDSVAALLDLDFTELVKGLKPSEIKEFVHATKIKIVKDICV